MTKSYDRLCHQVLVNRNTKSGNKGESNTVIKENNSTNPNKKITTDIKNRDSIRLDNIDNPKFKNFVQKSDVGHIEAFPHSKQRKHDVSNSSNSPPKSTVKVTPPTNLQPYLKGLVLGKKKYNTDSWKEIEWFNLDRLANDRNSRREFLISVVKLQSLKKHIRNCELVISESCTECIIKNTRNKKYLILITDEPKNVVGICHVVQSEMPAMVGSGCQIKVSFLCLSNANVKTPLTTYPDGTEVPSNVAMEFLQKYMLAFRKNQVTTVIRNLFVSSIPNWYLPAQS